MSVSDRESGVVAAHIRRLEDACRALNVCLLIRPTEYDSTQLIAQGYATKSMSVHDKSSNWGPMAGFVPCDQFFCKKFIGQPNPRPDYHAHGPAVPVHLILTEALVSGSTRLEAIPNRPSTAQQRFYKAKGVTHGAAKDIVFRLDKAEGGWAVNWLKDGEPVKIFVWGYTIAGKPTPVTGDYDLWMVAPHMNWWKLQMQVVGVNDEHGASAATLLNNSLLGRLNEACGRSDNPVFNHGAEAQNYGFTQAIDSRVAMFTPAGGSRMVDRGDLPQALTDLQNAGYLVCWNKRYGESDPMLSGSAFKGTGLPFPMSEIEGMLKQFDKTGKRGALGHLAKTTGDQKLTDMLDIREFKNKIGKLSEEMKSQTERQAPKFLKVGDREDLPDDYATKRGGADTLQAQLALQRALTSSTTGGGETDLKVFEQWMDQNIEHISTLCEAYGEAPGVGGEKSGGFLLEKIPGTNSYKRN